MPDAPLVAAHRAHHDGSPLYVSTQSPSTGDVVTLRLRTHRDHQPESVVFRTVRDGEPFNIRAEAKEGDGVDVWWVAQLEVRNVVTRYRWLLCGGAYGYEWLTAGGLVDFDVPDATDFVLSATPGAPDWALSSVVYQVFPDRFARTLGEPGDLATAPPGADLPGWAVPRRWTDAPEGRSPNTPREFFGGDLDGIRERLGHLQDIGATTLYLTPVFPAGSTHRYDSTSFDRIDPLLGGDAAWTRLVEDAHARGIRVIGDITLNHCGSTHAWFVAAQDPEAPEREFFLFDPDLPHGYECWLGVRSLPKFDHRSAALRERLVDGPDSVIRQWMRGTAGLDGWRVDVANMTGRMGAVDLCLDVARSTRRAMDEERPDAYLVAEHGHDASEDLAGDGWMGTMNYAGFTRQVWCWLRSPEYRSDFLGLPVETPVITGEQAVESLRAFHARIPWRALLGSWNILSSHDIARVRTVVGTRERQEAALGLAIGLPGIPMVFAGDEIGATGWWGEDSRTPFPWQDPSSWDLQTLAAYRTLLTLRATSPALAEGGLRWLHVSADAIAFVREHPSEAVLVVVSRGQSEPVRLGLADINATSLSHVHGFSADVVAGQAVIDIPSAGAGVWRVEGR